MTTSAAARAAALALLSAALTGAQVGCQPSEGGDEETSAAAQPDAAAAASAERPSFVIVDIDTLRADRLGCYGNARPTSPAIDGLAAEGVRFEWAFSQAPHTPPSQASILSSLYPSSHGVETRRNRLPREVVTLAESLRAAGWATGGFVDGGYMAKGFGLGQGFGDYDDRGGGVAAIGPKALGWLRDHAAEPFLLFVHTYDVHTPYDPPEPYRGMFLDGLAPPTPGFEPSAEQMEAIRESQWTDHPLHMAPQDLAYARALYDAGIRYVDDWVATLVAEIDRLELAEKVVVVVISDHGEEFLEHGSVLHEKLYATVTRVPLILRLPGRPGGRVVPDVVETIDMMPTLLELAGVAPPPEAQGRSLLPTADRRSDAAARSGPSGEWAAFSESPWYGKQRAVTKGRYRLIYTLSSAAVELYDLGSDPFEQRDLAAAMPARVSELRRELAGWRDRVGASVATGELSRIDAETREQLKALGYLK